MGQFDRIELNPKVCNGKPVIKGTRIPVSIILDQVAEDNAWDDICEGYPEITVEDIQAVLFYAGEFINHTEIKTIAA